MWSKVEGMGSQARRPPPPSWPWVALLGTDLTSDRVEVTLPLRSDAPALGVGHLLDDLERLELLEDVTADGARAGHEFLRPRTAHHPPTEDPLERPNTDAIPQVDAARDRGGPNVVPVKIEVPKWADLVKTGTTRELAPYDP